MSDRVTKKGIVPSYKCTNKTNASSGVAGCFAAPTAVEMPEPKLKGKSSEVTGKVTGAKALTHAPLEKENEYEPGTNPELAQKETDPAEMPADPFSKPDEAKKQEMIRQYKQELKDQIEMKKMVKYQEQEKGKGTPVESTGLQLHSFSKQKVVNIHSCSD